MAPTQSSQKEPGATYMPPIDPWIESHRLFTFKFTGVLNSWEHAKEGWLFDGCGRLSCFSCGAIAKVLLHLTTIPHHNGNCLHHEKNDKKNVPIKPNYHDSIKKLRAEIAQIMAKNAEEQSSNNGQAADDDSPGVRQPGDDTSGARVTDSRKRDIAEITQECQNDTDSDKNGNNNNSKQEPHPAEKERKRDSEEMTDKNREDKTPPTKDKN